MIVYPSSLVIPRNIDWQPANSAAIDVADSGIIRVASLSAIDVYALTIRHPLMTIAQRDVLMSFYEEYKNQTVGVCRADQMVWECPLVGYPQFEIVSPTYVNATTQLQGRRIKSVVPTGYGSFEPTMPTVTIVAGGATAAADATIFTYGLQSLKINKTATDGLVTTVALAATATTYNTTITANRKWLIIASVYQTGALRSITLGWRRSDAVTVAASTAFTPAALSTWTRFARIIDLSASALTTGHIRFDLQSTMASGNACYVDGVVMIDITDYAAEITETVFPTAYMAPEPP